MSDDSDWNGSHWSGKVLEVEIDDWMKMWTQSDTAMKNTNSMKDMREQKWTCRMVAFL